MVTVWDKDMTKDDEVGSVIIKIKLTDSTKSETTDWYTLLYESKKAGQIQIAMKMYNSYFKPNLYSDIGEMMIDKCITDMWSTYNKDQSGYLNKTEAK